MPKKTRRYIKMTTKPEKTVTIIIRIMPESLRTALKIRAAETGVSMQQLTINAIVKYLKE